MYNAGRETNLSHSLPFALCAPAADIRVGVIGTDTSHVPAFAKLLNGDPTRPTTSPARASSPPTRAAARTSRRASTASISSPKTSDTKYGVEIVPDIATLLSKVDVVLLDSLDGRVHLEQARPVIAAHKPLFIDKPLAATLEDAREIARLAKAAGRRGSVRRACASVPSAPP